MNTQSSASTTSELPSLALFLQIVNDANNLYVPGERKGTSQTKFFKQQTQLRLILAALFMYADYASMPDELRDVIFMAIKLGDGIARLVRQDAMFDCSPFLSPDMLEPCLEMIEERLEPDVQHAFHMAFSTLVSNSGSSMMPGRITARGSFEYPNPFPNSSTFSKQFEYFCSNIAPAVVRDLDAPFSQKYAHIVIKMLDVLLGETVLFFPFDLANKYQKSILEIRDQVSSWQGIKEEMDVYQTDSLVKPVAAALERLADEMQAERIYEVFHNDVKDFILNVLRVQTTMLQIMIQQGKKQQKNIHANATSSHSSSPSPTGSGCMLGVLMLIGVPVFLFLIA